MVGGNSGWTDGVDRWVDRWVRMDKQTLLTKYKGAKVGDLPTPAFLIDLDIFKSNAQNMLASAHRLNWRFRPHVKTHKTIEGTRIQLGSGSLSTDRIVASTLAEMWGLLPLVDEGLISSMLYSLPVVKSRLGELAELATKVPFLLLMVDSDEQVDLLTEYSKHHPMTKKWWVFIKIDTGTKRAGLVNGSARLTQAIRKVMQCESSVGLYGFYCHAGHSYSCKTLDAARELLLDEIQQGETAARQALAIDPDLSLTISVGSTPTALASSEVSGLCKLLAQLELHAGNYVLLDQQQVATGCVTYKQVAAQVLAEVVSTYPERGDAPGEQLINAGVLALARELGPVPGHGRVVNPKGYENWIIGRLSQEHGVLTVLDKNTGTEFIPLGTKVGICPQHSCIAAAMYGWYFIVERDVVVDVWVPLRGW